MNVDDVTDSRPGLAASRGRLRDCMGRGWRPKEPMDNLPRNLLVLTFTFSLGGEEWIHMGRSRSMPEKEKTPAVEESAPVSH